MRKTPKTREEALAMMQKRQNKISKGDEAHLQAEIVRSFANACPGKRGALIGTFQNMDNGKTGANMVAMGLVKGVSDLLYFEDGKCIGIEVKHPEFRHNGQHCLEQANWIKDNCYRGGFCTSVEMFWDMVNEKSNGIPPEKIIQEVQKGTKTICFKNLL